MDENITLISQVAGKLLEIGSSVDIESEKYCLIPTDMLSPEELKIAEWMVLQHEISSLLYAGETTLCKEKMLELVLMSMELSVEHDSFDFITDPSFLKLKDRFITTVPRIDNNFEDCVSLN